MLLNDCLRTLLIIDSSKTRCEFCIKICQKHIHSHHVERVNLMSKKKLIIEFDDGFSLYKYLHTKIENILPILKIEKKRRFNWERFASHAFNYTTLYWVTITQYTHTHFKRISKWCFIFINSNNKTISFSIVNIISWNFLFWCNENVSN